MKFSKYNHLFNSDGKNVLYNSMTKAFAKVDESMAELDCSYFDEATQTILKENGFAIEENFDETQYLKYIFNQYYFDNGSLNVVMVPSLACNFNCSYCFEKGKHVENQKAYFDIFERYANKHLSRYRSVQFSLFGGEPLLFIDEFYQLISRLQKLVPNISTSIVTNGSLFDKTVLKKLVLMNCMSIQITIDGYEKAHDKYRHYANGEPSYKDIIENINMILAECNKDIKFILRINLNNVTVENVKTTLSDIHSPYRNNVNVLFRPIYSTDQYKEINENKLYDLKKYYDLASGMNYKIVKNNYLYKTCEACGGDNFFYLMPDLSMWKCINDLDHKEACIGRIAENGDAKFNIENLVRWNKLADCFQDGRCVNCHKLPDCFGGCIFYNSKNKKRLCKDFEMASLPYMYK